jgi:hypothetical protein
VDGQSRVLLVVHDRKAWRRIVGKRSCSRIEWWRRVLHKNRPALWQLVGGRELSFTVSCARSHSRVLAPGRAARSHAGDSRACFVTTDLICRTFVRALQRHDHSLIEEPLVVKFFDSTICFSGCCEGDESKVVKVWTMSAHRCSLSIGLSVLFVNLVRVCMQLTQQSFETMS